MSVVTETNRSADVSSSQQERIRSELAVTGPSWLPFVRMTWTELIESAEREAGSQQALAKLVGVTSSALGRAQKTAAITTCLRLARATHRSAETVLRAAGKNEVADLCVELFGQATPTLNDEERDILRTWKLLPPAVRLFIDQVLHDPKALLAGQPNVRNVTNSPPASPVKGVDQHGRSRTRHFSVIDLRKALAQQIDVAEKHARIAREAAGYAAELAAEPGVLEGPTLATPTTPPSVRKPRT
jgi:hypothetical protein